MSHQVRRAGFILIFILVMSMAQPGLCFYWNWKFHVHLLNRLSSNAHPLMVHVRSGDDDLGEHAVWGNGDFQFHFKLNFWETTLFYCDFTYGGKHKRFDVFVDGDYKSESCVCNKPHKTVYWRVEDDGFYRSCDDQQYVKVHDWHNW